MKRILLFFLCASNLFGALPFKPLPVETDVAGYNIYLGKTPTTLTLHKSVGKEIKSIDFLGLEPATYYFQVEAVSIRGEKSGRSPMISYVQTIPLPPPTPKRYINVQMSTDGGKTYVSIGKVPYPKITGQKYKTNIVTEK